MTSSHIRGENKKKGEKKIVSLVFDADVYLKKTDKNESSRLLQFLVRSCVQTDDSFEIDWFYILFARQIPSSSSRSSI